MGVGYLILGKVKIAIDVFSSNKNALRAGKVRILDSDKDLKKQIYEALSGNKWDESMDRLEKLFTEE